MTSFFRSAVQRILPTPFSSARYWESRYARGGNSGAGSYGRLALFKASVLNTFVAENAVRKVVELGCGDGNQLRLANYPRYVGYDISQSAIDRCSQIFQNDNSKQFLLLTSHPVERGDLTISLDVIFHLVEDDIFERYMCMLFNAAIGHVIIYSSNTAENAPDQSPHVRHRAFSSWISVNRPEWKLQNKITNPFPYDGDGENTSFADFYIYSRCVQTAASSVAHPR